MTAEYARAEEPEAALTPHAFRHAVGRFATGITVVTACVDGIDHAMTANAFTSVSLEPLLVLVCVEKVTRFHEAVLAAGRWGVSILAAEAEEASRWYATRGRPLEGQMDRFAHVHGEHSGAALLTDALATLECRTYAVYDGGDHSIVVGEVLSAMIEDSSRGPLLYYGGKYQTLGD